VADQQPDYQQQDPYATDLNVKLRDIEEKQNLIKDRILLIGENLISEKQETEEELHKLKLEMKNIQEEVKKIKLAIQRLAESQENFARKSQVDILERQFKMFQPLELARIQDVKDLINQALNKE
jgi:predicted nuclease with TOPRIM domain